MYGSKSAVSRLACNAAKEVPFSAVFCTCFDVATKKSGKLLLIYDHHLSAPPGSCGNDGFERARQSAVCHSDDATGMITHLARGSLLAKILIFPVPFAFVQWAKKTVLFLETAGKSSTTTTPFRIRSAPYIFYQMA